MSLWQRLPVRGCAPQCPSDCCPAAPPRLLAGSVRAAAGHIRACLGGDLSCSSALRCLLLYLQRLGGSLAGTPSLAGRTLPALQAALTNVNFAGLRPSLTAAAVLYADRLARGRVPAWPAALAALTGDQGPLWAGQQCHDCAALIA